MSDDLLTDAEHELVDALGRCAERFVRIVKGVAAEQQLAGEGPGVEDAREFVGHIHACQQQVLSQAAARAYPNRYRLVGGRVQS
jgi:hypothetical protein